MLRGGGREGGCVSDRELVVVGCILPSFLRMGLSSVDWLLGGGSGSLSVLPCSFLRPSPADPWCSPWTGVILRGRSKPTLAGGPGQAGESSWVGPGPRLAPSLLGPAQPCRRQGVLLGASAQMGTLGTLQGRWPTPWQGHQTSRHPHAPPVWSTGWA